MTLEEFKVSADFKWDLANKKIYEDVTVNSGDVNGRKMRVQVVDGKLIRDLTGYTLNLGWKNLKDPTAKGLDAFKVVDITKGIFEIPYTTAMLSNVGRLIAALQLIGIDDVVESNNFLITVRNSNIDADAIQTESSFTALTEALVTVNQLNAEFDAAMLGWGTEFDDTLAGWTSTLSTTNDTFAQMSADAEAAYIAQSAGFNATFEANEVIRDGVVAAAIETEMIAQNVATKLTEKEATFAPRMLSVEQQLEQTLNKSAITLSHMFADATARDAYFVAHPTELMEQLFIRVGTGYQQYLEGAWQASAAIVTEQLSATNQPIIDTGNYFATDNTNAALQELGEHKASAANPHGVTKAQVGLGNVDNTSDANKPVSVAMQAALNLKVSSVNDVLPDENGNVTIEAGGGDKLVATVTYNSNVELTPTALDVATGTFTIPNHGLTANTKIAPNFNANNGFPAILGVYPGGMTQEQYFVIVVDADNIKLSKTSGGAPITITSAGVQSKWHFEKWNVGSVNISGLPPKNKYRVVAKGNVLWAGNTRIVPLTPNWYTADWNSNWYPLLTPIAPGYWHIDVRFEVLPVNKIIGTAFNIKPNTTLINTLTNIDIKYIRAAHNAAQITAVSAQFSEFIGNGMIVEVYDIEQSV